MEEEKALRNYCTTMIARARNKQQQTDCSDVARRKRQSHGAGRGREKSESERAEHEFRDQTECNLPLRDCGKRGRGQTSFHFTCQGPEVQPVPVQLLAMLRLKTFREDVKRAAEVELHDPAACAVCEQENASLALKSFIRRKKTQLHFQTLKGRLNTNC